MGKASYALPRFCLEWSDDIKAAFILRSNHKVCLANSDLKCAGLILLWFVMEAVLPFEALKVVHVALFSDNQPTVSWIECFATQSSLVADKLLRILALRMHKARVSPLTAMYILGNNN